MLQIKVNGVWAALPPDFSINMQQQSPLFNKQETFSFPFSLSVAANAALLATVTHPHTALTLDALNGLPVELWLDGLLIGRGSTETATDMEITDSVSMNYISGVTDFRSRIEKLNARDVALDRDIPVGRALWQIKLGQTMLDFLPDGHPEYYVVPSNKYMDFDATNVSQPWPLKPYCNVRICAQAVNEEGNPDGMRTLEAHRPGSGMCFYVMYWLHCLFHQLGIAYDATALNHMEDINRLAFFTTHCDCTYRELDEFNQTIGGWTRRPSELVAYTPRDVELTFGVASVNGNDTNYWPANHYDIDFAKGVKCYYKSAYATNQNFPDIEAERVISDLENAFGIVFLFDTLNNSVRLRYAADIMRDPVIDHPIATVLAQQVTQHRSRQCCVSYSNVDALSGNYTDYSMVDVYDNYNRLLDVPLSRTDRATRIDRTTGNVYRVKVDKETGDKPALFEVGTFQQANVGAQPGVEPHTTDERKIEFAPVIYTNTTYEDTKLTGQETPAVFVDTEMCSYNQTDKDYLIVSQRIDPGVFSWLVAFGVFTHIYMGINGKNLAVFPDQSTGSDDEEPTINDPLQELDCGYTLGIMRGAGNESGIETITTNYDGEGNDEFAEVAANYAFTSDACDSFGRFYDYNGTQGGGADQSGRFSLKLTSHHPGYPCDAAHAGRGLVEKFLSELLYLKANARLVTLTVQMSMSQIMHMDLMHRQHIGDFVGFVNKITYTLHVTQGIQNVKVEMYVL